MSSNSLLNIGSSGLRAFQNSLNTVGHNISNANTEGYSRQNVDLAARRPDFNGFGFIGSGVGVATVSRSYDSFVEDNLRNSTSAAKEFEVFHSLATQIDNVLADPDSGMSKSMQSFFDSIQDVSGTPSALATREVLLAEGRNVAGQFNELSGWLNGVRGQLNTDLRGSVTEINRLTSSIAELNGSIKFEQGRAGGNPANDLLDQRDVQIRELAELVSIKTVQQDDGAINILGGIGQALVVGNRPSTLDVFNEGNDPNQLGVGLRGVSGVLVPITDQLSGGKIGGLISFRDQMLDPATNSLGLVAIGLSHYMNEQQTSGMDLDNKLGSDFFSEPKPQTLTLSGTPGNVTTSFDDVSQLTNKDYKLSFNAGTWELTQQDTTQLITMTGTGTALDPFIAEGLSIEVAAAPTNGDSYLIRPTREGSTDIAMTLSSNRQIAAASPVRSLASNSNVGTGVASAGNVTDINNSVFQTTSGQLSPPILIRFTTPTSYDVLDNSTPLAPTVIEAGVAYNPTTGGDVFPTPGGVDHGYRFEIKGAPVAGDEFSSEYNSGGIGDNRNARLMAEISDKKLLLGGSSSITDNYSVMVAEIGSDTKQSELTAVAKKGLLESAKSSRDSVAGVNLDEEAAALVRYQQAYQAAAQVVSVANSLFDIMLNATRS